MFQNNFQLKKIINFIENEGISNKLVITSINDITKLILLNEFYKTEKKIIFVTYDNNRALKFNHDLSVINGDLEPKIFPFQDVSPYEIINHNLYKYKDQINIIRSKPPFIVTSVRALTEKFPLEEYFSENKITLKKNDDIEPFSLAQKLVNLGYRRVTQVSDIGEFSLRGDILDVFGLDDNPLRIEFWGDTISDIRYFNVDNQRSINHLENASILPLYKYVEKNENQDFAKDDFYCEYFEGKYAKNLKSLVEIFKEDYIFVFDETVEILNHYQNLDTKYNEKYQQNIKEDESLTLENSNHCNFEDFKILYQKLKKICFENFLNEEENAKVIEFESEIANLFSADVYKIAQFVEQTLNKNYSLTLATDYQARVIEILKDFETDTTKINFINNLSLGGGISHTLNFVVLTDKELFNKISKDVTSKKYNYKKESIEFIENINDIKEGDYVVHRIHGVGRYLGLNQMEIDGEFKDYLTIEYANNDKLHIVAEQINMLSRYRGVQGGSVVKLSKMGGSDWKNVKKKTKAALEDVARELINLYASRKVSKGIKFDPDTPWQYELEESFPYTETEDQMKAIIETKQDMETDVPMDRLICADVGFGKTEIALRAAFKAITSGKQVVLVVPTTILALQHFETFQGRFSPYPISIELLTRFKSKAEQKKILTKLSMGEVDLVIGTHRLLQNDVKFKDLGLLIIDEEHRFGVKHKEKLKSLKKNIDILSMSATPIPRTLYMSLSGIKNLSVINTPPQNRLPIKTQVCEMNDNVIKNAINYELDREGQVFVLYNRVETIYEFASYIQKLVPNAKIAVGHGQLDEKTLEQVMVDFANGEYNVLVATTIIESGLNIENANTIIITNSEKFGLAQLYQLRGRVGRAQRQAYCYCLYNKSKNLTEEAIKRLKAIKDFTTLGSGYQIALRDIEIRGVGNLLGTKQHGHMMNVGFDTYCELLDEAIKELKGEKTEKTEPTIVDINVTAFIPETWVGDYSQKMIEYKRLANVENEAQLELIISEWKDRFSKMPSEVENLIKLIRLRLLATNIKISSIRQTPDGIRIYTPFNENDFRIISSKLEANVKKHLKFIKAPKTLNDTKSILIFDNKYMTFDEIFNMLASLFYYISCVSLKY